MYYQKNVYSFQKKQDFFVYTNKNKQLQETKFWGGESSITPDFWEICRKKKIKK